MSIRIYGQPGLMPEKVENAERDLRAIVEKYGIKRLEVYFNDLGR